MGKRRRLKIDAVQRAWMRKFADELRRSRLEHGLSLTDIGELVSMSASTVLRWEHGKTRPTTASMSILIELFPSLASIAAHIDRAVYENNNENTVAQASTVSSLRELFRLTLANSRMRRSLTQKQTADLIDVNNRLISHWESGRRLPMPDQVRALVALFPDLLRPAVVLYPSITSSLGRHRRRQSRTPHSTR